MKPNYWLTRFWFLRGLGLIYLIGFAVIVQQFIPLVGQHGILPATQFLAAVRQHFGPGFAAVWNFPTLFWLHLSDAFMRGLAIAGIVLSLTVLCGFANSVILFGLWLLYMSFVHVGQVFYGFGWEMMLLETGFLAIFLTPFWDPRPFPPRTPPPHPVIWLLRWELFRVMFGAALIKLRGDPCWSHLTCLDYHFETQPLPNPLSPFFHQLPEWLLHGGVLFNHFAELVVPWFIFGPRRMRHIAGLILIAFQGLLILSGNLSWLNWLTIVLCLACFDDSFFKRLLPHRMRDRLVQLSSEIPLGRWHRGIVYGLVALVAVLSLQPVLNLVSTRQAMNQSYDPFHLVNTYGAFGSVTKVRREVILLGTSDTKLDQSTVWHEYEFKCKPGNIYRRPCIISPFHYRLDWQIWFAAMSRARYHPWLFPFIEELLKGNKQVLSLLADNPFPQSPPHYIRADLYEYHFAEPHAADKAWWRRRRLGPYLPPLTLKNGQLEVK